MGYEVASLMGVGWEKPMELPWSNMEHGGYEVMARVVGCCWWVLLGSTVLYGGDCPRWKQSWDCTTTPRLVKRCR
jgi:hypothetical protein